MNLNKLDRWLGNAVLHRARVFKVDLADCCDEFGNSFGKEGTHFFVRALAQSETPDSLQSFYKDHPVRSFNEVIGKGIRDEAGERYFCPWEPNRIRPLSNFEHSHKAGPTSEETLARIVHRLLRVLDEIRNAGFRQYSIFDGFPRVIGVIDRSGRRRYIVRDGQHRAAVLSHLGFSAMRVTYEADHFKPSLPYRWIASLFKRGSFNIDTPKIVREDEVDSWPHVLEGRVLREDALAYFQAVFGRKEEQVNHLV